MNRQKVNVANDALKLIVAKIGDKMDKNKANAPKIRFPGFTDPWEQRKVGDYYYFKNGLNKGKEFFGHGVPIVNFTDVFHNRGINALNLKGKVSLRPSEIANYMVQKGDIFFTRTSETIDEIGYPSVMIDEPKDTVFSGFVLRGRAVKEDPLTIKFKQYVFYTDEFRNEMIKKSSMTTRALTSGTAIKQMESCFPKDKREQNQIGNFFASLDKLITLHQRKLNHLQDKKKSLLQKMFPKNGENFPELRFPGFTDPWEQLKLGKVGDTFTGLSGKTKEDFGHGDAKFVTYVNVFGNVISDPNDVQSLEIDDKQNQVKCGDVFFTTSSETPEEVGMSSVWLENTENVYLNSFCFGYRPTVEFDLYYLAFMLRSPEIRKKFMFLAQGISRYNISKNKVMEMNVPVPEINEQRKVGTFFRNLDNLITLHQRKLNHLQQQKKGLLQQMFI